MTSDRYEISDVVDVPVLDVFVEAMRRVVGLKWGGCGGMIQTHPLRDHDV